MGLKSGALDILQKIKPWESVLCLSYPDILIPFEVAQEVYPVTKRAETGRWHGEDFDLPETTELFTLMGAKSIRYVDIHSSRGCEEIADLNEPQDFGKHDLVIDPGTTEHCFNVGCALMNAAQAVKVGGHILHVNPASMVNHGFWGFNPTLYWDFYTQNGFVVRGIWLDSGDDLEGVPAVKRIQIPPEAVFICLAQRMDDSPLRYPTQTKYLKNPDLKGSDGSR